MIIRGAPGSTCCRASPLSEASGLKDDYERIPVYILFEKGRAVCVCHAGRKLCRRQCQRDTVTRDKFEGWRETLYRNRYGK